MQIDTFQAILEITDYMITLVRHILVPKRFFIFHNHVVLLILTKHRKSKNFKGSRKTLSKV